MDKLIEGCAERSWRNYVKKSGGNIPGPSSLYEHGFGDGVDALLNNEIFFSTFTGNGWRDVTSYSRSEPRVPRAWEFKDTRICIHRHKDYAPDIWLVSWYSRGVENIRLNALDELEAKKEAIAYCLTKLIDDLKKLHGQ